MKVFSQNKLLFKVFIITLFTLISCGDNCEFKYQQGIEVGLEGITDRKLVSAVFITKINDTIVEDSTNNISIGGGFQTREENVSIFYNYV
jgi:hypothetical protein